MKLDFLLCGSPNDGFYSQFAFFRASLNRLGGFYRDARVVAVFGDDRYVPLPDRWKPHFQGIDVEWVAPREYHRRSFFAQCDRRYRLIRPDADLACLCDADTVLLRPFPSSFLKEIQNAPSIAGVVAHYPFPIDVDQRGTAVHPIYPEMDPEVAWENLGRTFLGRPLDLPLHYTLQPKENRRRSPFYANYGFLAAPPGLFERLYEQVRLLGPEVSKFMGNRFYGQVTVTLAIERRELPWRALPMRYNFPNDPVADRLHPGEMKEIVLLHYLRTGEFDRQKFLANEDAFESFLAQELSGSNSILQKHVLHLTGARYPFT